MKKRILLLVFLMALLCGCEMRTVDKMYVPPERSDDHSSLQAVINSAIVGLEYSAPVTGENQQLVQLADLDGDDVPECLLYAKGGTDRPMHILIFSQEKDAYIHSDTIDLVGSSFDKVEYAQIDGRPGVEIVVGTQVSNQVSRSVSVFSFFKGEAEQLVTADYLNFLTVDLNSNGLADVFVLRAGPTENDRGIVELFGVNGGSLERSLELNLSETPDKLKRIRVGKLHGGESAVYVASAVDEDTLITDVFTVTEGVFTNVSLSNDSGTGIKTMRNYFVYANDIDSDGVMELPRLIPMRPIDTAWHHSVNHLVCWYSMTVTGEQIVKQYTYHNFLSGWYIHLDEALAGQISVMDLGSVCDFYIWDEGAAVKLFSVEAFTGQSRESQSSSNGFFPLYKTESTVYAARLDDGAAEYRLTQEDVIRSFYLIRERWNTGET